METKQIIDMIQKETVNMEISLELRNVYLNFIEPLKITLYIRKPFLWYIVLLMILLTSKKIK